MKNKLNPRHSCDENKLHPTVSQINMQREPYVNFSKLSVVLIWKLPAIALKIETNPSEVKFFIQDVASQNNFIAGEMAVYQEKQKIFKINIMILCNISSLNTFLIGLICFLKCKT